jgi:hypothetical protein
MKAAVKTCDRKRRSHAPVRHSAPPDQRMLHQAIIPTSMALLAQAGKSAPPFSWAIVILCVVLGLIVTLSPARRTSEVKRRREY